jgi:hypothetical protein
MVNFPRAINNRRPDQFIHHPQNGNQFAAIQSISREIPTTGVLEKIDRKIEHTKMIIVHESKSLHSNIKSENIFIFNWHLPLRKCYFAMLKAIARFR